MTNTHGFSLRSPSMKLNWLTQARFNGCLLQQGQYIDSASTLIDVIADSCVNKETVMKVAVPYMGKNT